jgi:hypothetical protein
MLLAALPEPTAAAAPSVRMLLLERCVAHRARSAGDLTDVACGLHLHRTLLLATPVNGR